MISIIIPLYNQAKKLDKCLASIKNQTYSNYEIIVVNDRSLDRLSHLIKKYKNEFGIKIEFIHNSTNHGAPYSRNKGYLRSKGEYILFCDADIVLAPNALEKMLETLRQNPNASYAYPAHKYGHKLFRLWPFDAEKLKQMPYIHSTALVRREHLPDMPWDEELKRLQDWDLWLKLLKAGHTGAWVSQTLFRIQGGGNTMSGWLPSFAYKLFPFLPRAKKYKQAVAAVKKKHELD
ncbi:MAG: glycosyltransferase family 2 protein [Patescibacteria group bacterium]|nr:glycosyltransferase family 2 protein [Patescibacteria group bacterium]